MIEIKGMGQSMPIPPEDADRERLKEVKSRAGKVAFTRIFGEKRDVSRVSAGISRSEGTLKWIEEVFNKEAWKNS